MTLKINFFIRIVQFTDLHYGETDAKDINSQQVQRTILKSEQPDLVVLSGDAVSGYGWDKKTPNWFPRPYAKLTQPMVEYNVPVRSRFIVAFYC